ncbi:MAG: NUMOD3 domain-containing DNA-binding protein [Candidatus Nitrosotenuis sp.]
MLKCPVCQKELSKIDVQHLKKHSLTKEEYFLTYGNDAPFGYSEELRLAKSGVNHPQTGKKRSLETREKISNAVKSLWQNNLITDAQKNAIGKVSKTAALTGNHFNKGKKHERSTFYKQQLSKSLLKYFSENPKHFYTEEQLNKWHAETKTKISKTKRQKLIQRYETNLLEWATVKEFNIDDEECYVEVCCNSCSSNIKVQLQTVRKHNFSKTLCHTCFPIFRGTSNLEDEIYQELLVFSNFEIRRHDKSILKNLELDFYIPEKQIAIEVDGLYWHSDLAGYNSLKHLVKTEACEKQGIHLIHIFENEWLYKRDLVISRLKAKLGYSNKIYARCCTVVEIDARLKKQFLVENHLQGDTVSAVNIALKYQNEIVAVMTLGCPRFSKKHEWELIRYCSIKHTNIVGGASKLFSYFLKTYNPKNIVSYADRRWNTGNLYKSLNFDLIAISSPNYWYFKNTTMFHRMSLQKHKLLKKFDGDPDKTEWELAQENGFNRIWDCGNYVFYREFML